MRVFAWIELGAGAVAVFVALARQAVMLPLFYGGLLAVVAALAFLVGDVLADHPDEDRG